MAQRSFFLDIDTYRECRESRGVLLYYIIFGEGSNLHGAPLAAPCFTDMEVKLSDH